MVKNNNSKVTLQKLYDEIIPLLTDLATQKTDIVNIKEDIKEIKDSLGQKVSIKAFASWLSALGIIISIIITITTVR